MLKYADEHEKWWVDVVVQDAPPAVARGRVGDRVVTEGFTEVTGPVVARPAVPGHQFQFGALSVEQHSGRATRRGGLRSAHGVGHVLGLGPPNPIEPGAALQPDELSQRLGLAARHRHRRRRPQGTGAFLSLASALFDAALEWEGARMPELFCGFARAPGLGPTRYPVACSPQAWAAGVPFHLLSAMLGLAPDAHENRLSLMHPVLPPWLDWVEIRDLRLGGSSLDFVVSRGSQPVAVELLSRRGDAALIVRAASGT